MRTDSTIIELRDLVNGFGNKVLHDHIDLDVRRGEVLGVVGNGSGAGKFGPVAFTIIGLNHARWTVRWRYSARP